MRPISRQAPLGTLTLTTAQSRRSHPDFLDEFMNNEVPGIHVADEIMERMRKAELAGNAREEGIAAARETVGRLKGLVQGGRFKVSAPFGRYQAALDVLGGLTPRAA